ncbi:hypothetical protein [Cellulomonas sp. HZM]|uniref:hypothetical protein n=1 Tax=Cellulomonas sp. HZM TaxID=1454010 RepID=UPI0004931DF9|nr:hypothetical protein [Cellulomonas sp. HZM]
MAASMLIGAAMPVAPDPRPPAADQVEALAKLVDVEPSSDLDGPVLAAGEVDGADAGVPVIATAWPDQKTLDSQRPGDEVELVTIAATLTDSDGSFKLVADPGAVAELTGGNERTVNFDVTAANAGDDVAVVSTSAVLSPEIVADKSIDDALAGDVTIEADEPLTVDDVASARVRSGSATASGHVEFSTTDVKSTDGPAKVAMSAATVTAGYKCGTVLLERLDKRPTIIGSTYSTSSAVTSQFIYESGAESSFGVGASKSGAFGSWEASGTNKITNGDIDEFDQHKGQHGIIYKKFQNYGKYRNVLCDGDTGQFVSYSVRPIGSPYGSYEAGSPVPATSSKNCVQYKSKHTFSTGKAQNWTTGVTLEPLIGFNASAQSGYTTKAEIVMSRAAGTYFTVCGTGNVPQQSNSGRLVAK